MHLYSPYCRTLPKFILRGVFLLALLFLSGCWSDAPRDNPLQSNSAETYSFQGTVHTYYPHQPRSLLSGASVLLKPENRISVTGPEGTFGFKQLPAGSYTAIAAAAGFAADTLKFDLPGTSTHSFFLDGLPYFKDLSIESRHVSRLFPVEDLYYLELHLTASDTDGVE
ncbi:MAG: hypothetical protein WAN36_01835, partial [Calditrichia bacterium]